MESRVSVVAEDPLRNGAWQLGAAGAGQGVAMHQVRASYKVLKIQRR
jgi:hypothetical protein